MYVSVPADVYSFHLFVFLLVNFQDGINLLIVHMLLVLETHQVIHIELSFFDKLDFFNFLNVFVNLKDIGWVYCLNRLGVTIKVIVDYLHPIIISFTLNTSSYARSDTPWPSLHE